MRYRRWSLGLLRVGNGAVTSCPRPSTPRQASLMSRLHRFQVQSPPKALRASRSNILTTMRPKAFMSSTNYKYEETASFSSPPGQSSKKIAV